MSSLIQSATRVTTQTLACFAVALLIVACAGETGAQVDAAPRILPPDPVLGPDANADGVRDDIGEYIASTLAHDPLQRQAALQYAKASRAELATPPVREAVVAATTVTFRALQCASYIRRKAPETWDKRVLDEIEARTLDTDARIEAYFVREKLRGGVYAGPSLENKYRSCDFDTSSLRSAP